MFAFQRSRCVGFYPPVRYRSVSLINDQTDIKRGFQRWFVKGRKSPPSISGFKLRDGVVPHLAAGQVEPAQLIIENPGELQM